MFHEVNFYESAYKQATIQDDKLITITDKQVTINIIKLRWLLRSLESEPYSMALKVWALNSHVQNVCFSGAWTLSCKPSIRWWWLMFTATFVHKVG